MLRSEKDIPRQGTKRVLSSRSGQLADTPLPVTTRRSHSAGLPVSVRTQRVPPPLPVSITGQRSLQPHHVHPEHPPPPQRPPMTASAYQRSIYRGDSGRLAQGLAGQAQQPPSGKASASQAAISQLPGQSSAEEQASTEPGPGQQYAASLSGIPDGAQDAAQGPVVARAAGASTTVTAPTVTPNALSGDSSGDSPGQPEAPASSRLPEPHQQAPQQGSSSAPAAPGVQPQPLHMPPLPPPAVHHVHRGRAELNDMLEANLHTKGCGTEGCRLSDLPL